MTEIIDRSSIPGTVLLISDHIAIDIILSDHDRHWVFEIELLKVGK